MKIKITNYPYKMLNIGDTGDFGDELNASLVSMNRAVWAEPTRKNLKEVIKETVEVVTQSHSPKKKLITNSLREKVQTAKKQNLTVDSPKKKTDDDIDETAIVKKRPSLK